MSLRSPQLDAVLLDNRAGAPDRLRLHQKGDSAAPHKIMEDHPGKYRWCVSGDKRASRSAALIITKLHTFEREGKNSKKHLMDSAGKGPFCLRLPPAASVS